jgi:hypothetical protein
MVKKLLMQVLGRLDPKLLQKLRIARARRQFERFEQKVGLTAIKTQYFCEFDHIVRSGPFKGMMYLDHSCGSSLIPKLLGSYEKEIHEVLAGAIERKPNQIIDIGSAEGYYAVGMAMRLPDASVTAFDIDLKAQNACRNLATINKVADRVSIKGKCDANSLCSQLTRQTLIICDCEGYEYTLLSKMPISLLAGTDLIIELHQGNGHDPAVWFQSLFAASHETSIFSSQVRSSADAENAMLDNWPEGNRNLALNEFRVSGTMWGYAKSKTW